MANAWHYSIKGNRGGPVEAAELKRLATSGELSPSDFVWKEGLKEWVAASSVKGLFPAAALPPELPTGGSPSTRTTDLQPKVDAAVKATARVAYGAMKSFKASKPIAGFHIQRAVIGIASAVGMLATFMPWVTIPVLGTVYGTAGDGWLTLPLFIPALVFVLRGSRLQPISGWQRFAVAIPTALAALIGIQKIVSFNSQLANMRSGMAGNPFAGAMADAMSATTGTGIGLYLLVLAGAAAAAAVFVLNRKASDSEPA